jgi:hypothetical protein
MHHDLGTITVGCIFEHKLITEGYYMALYVSLRYESIKIEIGVV